MTRKTGSSSPWCKSIVAPRVAMRPAGKARRPRISGIFEGEATPPGGMQRRSNADGVAPRAANLLVIAFTVALVAGAQTARANTVMTGDIINFDDRNGSPGGEFLANVNPGTADAWSFVTFCLQKTEYIDFNSNFTVKGVTDYATSDPDSVGGISGRDPLDDKTAWLFTQFTNTGYGALASIGYDGSATQATLLVLAV